MGVLARPVGVVYIIEVSLVCDGDEYIINTGKDALPSHELECKIVATSRGCRRNEGY